MSDNNQKNLFVFFQAIVYALSMDPLNCAIHMQMAGQGLAATGSISAVVIYGSPIWAALLTIIFLVALDVHAAGDFSAFTRMFYDNVWCNPALLKITGIVTGSLIGLGTLLAIGGYALESQIRRNRLNNY